MTTEQVERLRLAAVLKKQVVGEEGQDLAIYAWVGYDEMGSGQIGLKQAITPAGMIPLAAMDYHLDRMMKLKPQLEAQAEKHGKKIRLIRFVAVELEDETAAGEWA